MGTEQSATYYDTHYKGSRIKSWRDYRSARKRLYKAAAGMIDPAAPLVIDLGCGPGHFADYLHANLSPTLVYLGVDFSKEAIRQAKRIGLPDNFSFMCAALEEFKKPRNAPAGTTFVLMETLEHIEDDLQVLDIIPAGCACIISVPQFDNPAHVRTFADMTAVRDRYGDIIDIQDARRVWKWHLFKGLKK